MNEERRSYEQRSPGDEIRDREKERLSFNDNRKSPVRFELDDGGCDRMMVTN